MFDDRIKSARGILAEADRFDFRETLKAGLQAEIALYLNLKQLVATGQAPPASRVRPEVIDSVNGMLDSWTGRVLNEANDLPIGESERAELRDTDKTAEALRR